MNTSDSTRPSSADTPAFKLNKHGAILPTVSNVLLAVSQPALCGCRFAFDAVTREVVIAYPPSEAWGPLSDLDILHVRMSLEQLGFTRAPKGLCKDAVRFVARANKVRGVTILEK